MYTGERIRQLRKKSSLSQEQLAEKLGVSRQAVSKWENGVSQPDTGNLYAMGKLFGVSVESLIAPVAADVEAGVKDGCTAPDDGRLKTRSGSLRIPVTICAAGAAGVLICIILILLFPSSASRLGGSSVITIDGTGLLIFISAAVSAAGGFMIFRRRKK